MDSETYKLILSDASQKFQADVVWRDVNLRLGDREILVILGRSGVGKTTLLNVASGLDKPASGQRTVRSGLRLSYMLQEEALFPWRNAHQNATFGCELQNTSGEGLRFVDSLLDRLQMTEAKYKSVVELSGGMKQRISFVRAMGPKPDILLLDEPFASVDSDMKMEMQRILIQHAAVSGAGIVVVTHDFDDAAILGKHVFILSGKRLEKIYSRDDWENRLQDRQNIGNWRRSQAHLDLVNEIMSRTRVH